jgi:DNA-binding response OmpR family regulator
MISSVRTSPVRVLIVADRPEVALVYANALATHGVPVTCAGPGDALTGEGWLAVLVVEQWAGRALSTLERLQAAGKQVAVLCPAARDPATALAMLKQGAVEAYPNDVPGLEALALKLNRRLGQHGVSRWRLGARIFEVDEARLLGEGPPVDLTLTESRLLRRFCRFRLTTPAHAIRAEPLGEALGIDA